MNSNIEQGVHAWLLKAYHYTKAKGYFTTHDMNHSLHEDIVRHGKLEGFLCRNPDLKGTKQARCLMLVGYESEPTIEDAAQIVSEVYGCSDNQDRIDIAIELIKRICDEFEIDVSDLI